MKTKKEKKERDKQWYEANKEKNLARMKEWRKSNPNYGREWRKANPGYHSEWHEVHPNYRKNYYEANKEESLPKSVKYSKDRRASDPSYKLMHNLRSRQRFVLTGVISTTEGLGCSSGFLKEYLEKQFTEGMSWDNYGNKEGQWSLDHIKPLSLYYDNPELLPQLIHYTNLQPMWHVENIKKGKKVARIEF